MSEQQPIPTPQPTLRPPGDGRKASRRVETILGFLLTAGVIASMVTIVTGVILLFVHSPGGLTAAGNLNDLTALGAKFPHTLPQIADGLGSGDGLAVISLGLLILIATPVLRVAVSAAAFASERDWTYVVLTVGVLALLMLSFKLGQGV